MKRPYVLPLILALAIPSAARAQPLAEPAQVSERNPQDEPLFVAGEVTFLFTYGVTAAVAAQSFDTDKRWLYIPLAGPWITLATDSPCANCEHATAWKGLLIADGIVQAAGVTMAITSLVINRDKPRDRGPRLVVGPGQVGVFGQF